MQRLPALSLPCALPCKTVVASLRSDCPRRNRARCHLLGSTSSLFPLLVSAAPSVREVSSAVSPATQGSLSSWRLPAPVTCAAMSSAEALAVTRCGVHPRRAGVGAAPPAAWAGTSRPRSRRLRRRRTVAAAAGAPPRRSAGRRPQSASGEMNMTTDCERPCRAHIAWRAWT